MLRAKDLLTLGNAASGLASILLCVQGRPAWAAWAVMVGYAFDVADGAVARAMGGSNRFGAELDNLADHTTFGIAPAYCIYLAYRPVAPALAVLLAGAFALAATVRHTRNLVYPVPTAGCWVGLPRPAAAFVAISFVQSRLFRLGVGPWIGAPLILGLCAASLGTWPFVKHHGRRMQWWARGFVVAWAGSWVLTALLEPAYFWDVVFGWSFGYALASWLALSHDERRDFFAATRAWKRAMASGRPGS